jgi:hypothetical protein
MMVGFLFYLIIEINLLPCARGDCCNNIFFPLGLGLFVEKGGIRASILYPEILGFQSPMLLFSA